MTKLPLAWIRLEIRQEEIMLQQREKEIQTKKDSAIELMSRNQSTPA